MRRRSLLAGMSALAALRRCDAAASPAAEPVDVLLVLALDGSGSLNQTRAHLQREGHAQALESARFVNAVCGGPCGRIAVAAFEWSSYASQHPLLPWAVIEDAASARAAASRLREAPRASPGYTSISGAIDHARGLLLAAPHEGTRMVLDISADGTNNDGRAVQAARDEAVASGITINGLPILELVGDLESYFADNVVGGPLSFSVAARDFASFGAAVLRKLVAEVAGLPLRSDPHSSSAC